MRDYLPRQRWFAGDQAPSQLTVVDQEPLREGAPALVDMLVEADGRRYQVVVGLRPTEERPDFLRGRDDAVIGEIDGRLAYDAVLDPELGMALLDLTSGGAESAERVRPVGGEQSNNSLVYDDRLILKVFRRVFPGRNLDVEMTEALADAGFDHVARPIGVLTRELDGEPYDLAVLQPFLAGSVDGWALSLTSLRDLFGVSDTQPVPIITADMLFEPPPPVDPADAGGDFAAEARRLGTITAEMHVGLDRAFGREPGSGHAWAEDIEGTVDSLRVAVDDRALRRLLDALHQLDDAGPAIRVHGDYHLGQVLRTDAGWYVLDFEGEPDRAPEERRRRFSPLRDVAGMLRSFQYASEVALFERDADCRALAQKWEARNRAAFLKGYLATARDAGLVPDPDATEVILHAFELEKAMYELEYERGHRPDWQSIPMAALHRLAAG